MDEPLPLGVVDFESIRGSYINKSKMAFIRQNAQRRDALKDVGNLPVKVSKRTANGGTALPSYDHGNGADVIEQAPPRAFKKVAGHPVGPLIQELDLKIAAFRPLIIGDGQMMFQNTFLSPKSLVTIKGTVASQGISHSDRFGSKYQLWVYVDEDVRNAFAMLAQKVLEAITDLTPDEAETWAYVPFVKADNAIAVSLRPQLDGKKFRVLANLDLVPGETDEVLVTWMNVAVTADVKAWINTHEQRYGLYLDARYLEFSD